MQENDKEETNRINQRTHRCPECGLHYTDEKTAVQCAEWCKQNKSCNLEITQFSLERRKR